MSDDDIGNAINRVEEQGRVRHGEHWQKYLSAIQRFGGFTPEGAKVLLSQADPVRAVADVGKEALLAEADAGNLESEIQYAEARQAEREAYKRLRGRR